MDFEKYKVKTTYPEKPKKPTRPGTDSTAATHRIYADNLEKWEVEMSKYRNDIAAIGAKEKELLIQFKNDLFDELGIADSIKREELYKLAWDYGHAHGLAEVYSYAEELSVLIIDSHLTRNK